ncbi:uncharacterized protein CMU_011680 [Cryptosporidium muris RN66]|uniref:SNARE domain-containing protein n=1 Tax=Cryptosporidium muris (strain RN66) TaxID=441375 RepID=B6AJ26_CRYMR|nr:uncharacterized protein CMU_011680 [Cryptosporidium muris RN66]EEA08217.1 hypothetical protein, conserved [Cryptosporidium muris RN66]|eukprot:XP_002142566.1 hypothetical protein [Cryptosporidium muris RN66]
MDRTFDFFELCEIPYINNNNEVSPFIVKANQICYKIQDIIVQLEKTKIKDIASLVTSKDSSLDLSSSITNKVQECQDDIVNLEKFIKPDILDKDELKALEANRRMIVSCIYTLLGELTSKVQEMMTRKLEHQYQKNKRFVANNKYLYSTLYSSLNNKANNEQDLYNINPDDGLTPEMQKISQDLLAHFTSDLDILRTSQDQLHEISNLMTFFSTKIQEQSEVCSSILVNARDTIESMDNSKDHLDKLEKYNRSRR